MTANGEPELSTPSTGPMKRKKFSFSKDTNTGKDKKVRSIELDDDSPSTKKQGVGTPAKAEAPKSGPGSITAFFSRSKGNTASAAPPKPDTSVVDVDESPPEVKPAAESIVQEKPPQPLPGMIGISTASQKPAPASAHNTGASAPTAPSKETATKMPAREVAPTLQKPASAPAVPPSAPAPGRLILQGMVFVFTGEMEEMPRTEAEEKVRIAGGKVTGSVSGNTTYLVVGSRLEDGRPVEETSKYRKYKEFKEKFDQGKAKKCPSLLTEEEFVKMLPGAQPPKAMETSAVAMTPTAGSSSSSTTGQVQPPQVSLPLASRSPSTSTLASKPNSAEGRDITGTLQDPNVGQLPWVDLHAPKDFGELVGNQGQVKKLNEWLRDWENVVLKGQTKKANFHRGMPENINARAALISGPPGIGKTTTCRLIAALNPKYELLEFNASDARGQKIIQSMADGVADNRTINFARKGAATPPPSTITEITKKALIIMDEVDGMAGGDRGGNAALIKMIKKTRNPIICICNDSQSPKMRSLSYSCYDLKFVRPPKPALAQRVIKIAQEHGIPVEPNAAEMLAESCGSDIRMVINQLQAMANSERCRQEQGVTYATAKEKMDGCKDVQVMLTPFDACKKVLNSSEGSKMSLMDRCDMFFLDYSLVPLLVQENYLKAVETKKTDPAIMQRVAFSAELFVSSDQLSNSMREANDWSLLPDMAITSCVYPAYITNGFLSFPQFPSFLGKYSTRQKTTRLSQELHAHLRSSTTATRRAMLTSGYVDLLYGKAMRPMLTKGSDGIDETMKVMDAYGLGKEHVTEHLPELRLHLGEEDKFKLVDSKVKSAMTRELNQGNHATKVVLPSKKRKTGGGDEAVDPDGEDDDKAKAMDVDEEEDAKSEEDGGGGNLVKARKGKGAAKSKAKARGRGKAKA
eukprot:gnl/MRDRNA2_/MRDRNA2_29725_c0_seq1.p1 gnl/MRDRNA2_/MRDRNA2_29725_c0~~gnl/MRDRNA2_/MRDRNA2_29725_c0_seq1.p1  ORF type:complete len:918 (-),score=219.65 gnl/MRDRNA2_/MRDRNA2_29725_c0_seq1:27-2780(-)